MRARSLKFDCAAARLENDAEGPALVSPHEQRAETGARLSALQALSPRQARSLLQLGLLSSFTLRAKTRETAGVLRAPSLQNMVWYGVAWHGMVWCGVVWCGVLWCGLVWYGVVLHGMVWYGMVWYGVVWYGMVWYGMVWYGVVWCGMVWCGVV